MFPNSEGIVPVNEFSERVLQKRIKKEKKKKKKKKERKKKKRKKKRKKKESVKMESQQKEKETNKVVKEQQRFPNSIGIVPFNKLSCKNLK